MYEVASDSLEICPLSLSHHCQTFDARAEEEGDFVRLTFHGVVHVRAYEGETSTQGLQILVGSVWPVCKTTASLNPCNSSDAFLKG